MFALQGVGSSDSRSLKAIQIKFLKSIHFAFNSCVLWNLLLFSDLLIYFNIMPALMFCAKMYLNTLLDDYVITISNHQSPQWMGNVLSMVQRKTNLKGHSMHRSIEKAMWINSIIKEWNNVSFEERNALPIDDCLSDYYENTTLFINRLSPPRSCTCR